MSAVILFDGVCNFCNGAVNFVIDRDRNGYFKFAALQSTAGEALMIRHGIDKIETDSVILIEDDKPYLFSSAALRIVRRLPGLWPLLYGFIIVPRSIRDWAYKKFAKHRYRLFGKREQCMIPTPEVRARFLT
jgi:predicted DCC family thiol-disulfide oxidoreductase YuxK